MNYKSYLGAKNTVASYIESIELIKERTEKNYLEMDLKNTKLNNEMEELLEDIKSRCNKVIRELESYSFE